MRLNVNFFYALGAVLCCLQVPARAQIVNIEEQRITGTNDSVRWYGHLRGSAALLKVREQSLQLAGEARVQYKTPEQLVLLLLQENLLRAGGNDFSKQAFAHLRYNYKLSDTWVYEAYGQLQTSPLQLLQQRHLAGIGLRWRALKSADGRQRLYLGSSWLWENNRFSAPLGGNAWHRSSNYVSVSLRVGKQTSLIGTTYWQPVWGYIRNYRFSTDWLLKIGITKQIALTLDVTYNLDKNLPAGAPAESYVWRNGLVWQLR